MVDLWLIVPAVMAGALAGLLGGMLGIGGGLVIVPALVWTYGIHGVAPALAMQLAVATSLASILFTGFSSVRAHHRRGAVRWDLVHVMAPALVAGALAGTALAEYIGGEWMMRAFGVFAAVMGLQMLVARARPQYAATSTTGVPPVRRSRNLHSMAAGVIGVASALFGIGGGSLLVPWLHYTGVRLQEAVGSSSACGMPIAVAGALGFMLAGWERPDLPPASLGYVHLPVLAALVVASMPLARVGASLAHRLPAATLRRVFAVLLLVVAGDFLWLG